MIVLDERRVVQADPVIHPSPHTYGVLFQCPQSRSGFSRIDHLAMESLYRIDIATRECRRPGETLQQIERRSFSQEEGPGRTFRFGHNGPLLHVTSISAKEAHCHLSVQEREEFL